VTTLVRHVFITWPMAQTALQQWRHDHSIVRILVQTTVATMLSNIFRSIKTEKQTKKHQLRCHSIVIKLVSDASQPMTAYTLHSTCINIFKMQMHCPLIFQYSHYHDRCSV